MRINLENVLCKKVILLNKIVSNQQVVVIFEYCDDKQRKQLYWKTTTGCQQYRLYIKEGKFYDIKFTINTDIPDNDLITNPIVNEKKFIKDEGEIIDIINNSKLFKYDKELGTFMYHYPDISTINKYDLIQDRFNFSWYFDRNNLID